MDNWLEGAENLEKCCLVDKFFYDKFSSVDMWSREDGSRDLIKLCSALPEDVVSKVLAIYPPNPYDKEDSFAWDSTVDGSFSVKTTYEYCHQVQDLPSSPF